MLPSRLRPQPAGLHLRPYELQLADDGLPGEVRGLRRIGARQTLEVRVAGRGGLIEVDLAADVGLPRRGDLVRLRPTGGVVFAG